MVAVYAYGDIERLVFFFKKKMFIKINFVFKREGESLISPRMFLCFIVNIRGAPRSFSALALISFSLKSSTPSLIYKSVVAYSELLLFFINLLS